MKVLTVVSHPRSDSLTFEVANRFLAGLREAGHQAELLDLHAIGFDPVLRESDEPDWHSEHQHYSPEVEREMERLAGYEGLAFVFPLWWWSVPAMLKGYLDRVWNYGFAYGPGSLQHRHVLWLALAGAPPHRFDKRRYDGMIRHYFDEGLASYVGIASSRVSLLYRTVRPEPGDYEQWLANAYREGLRYGEPAREPVAQAAGS